MTSFVRWISVTGIVFAAVFSGFPIPAVNGFEKAAEQTGSPDDAQFFEEKIRPLLATRCLECHGSEKQKGGLRLDSRGALATGGDSGPALVPGKPGESLVILALRYDGEIKMPPKSKLPDEEIALLTKWVAQGAGWPADDAPPHDRAPAKSPAQITDEDRAFWAFQPIADPPHPDVRNVAWPRTPIDRFILAELEGKGLSPAPPADKRTLIRRATFDLTGLPPTPAEVDAFLADNSPDAFATVVDRLLASPRYGERWGRHWLDIARYADSNGLDENLAYANAFRYRDYVVAAFNKDKPFDRFLQEQIAGDLLPGIEGRTGGPAGLDEALECITATGFLSLGGKMLAEDDPVKMQMDIVDEQVDTIGRAVMGLTLGCARCHDHKYDPVLQEDYYALAGIFKSTKTMENFKVVARWQERPLASSDAVAARDAQQKQIDTRKSEIAAVVEKANNDVLRDVRRHAGRYLLAAAARRQREEWLKKATPRGADPAIVDQPGSILIEAEEFARGNVLKDRENYGIGIGVLVNQGEQPNFTEYELTVAASGLYQCELRYAAAESRPTRLSINGRQVKADATGRVTGSWLPDSQSWFVEGIFALREGKNIVRLETAGVFPHIDKLLFTPVRGAVDEMLLRLLSDESQQHEVKQPFVAQWVKSLEIARSDPESPLALFVELWDIERSNKETSLATTPREPSPTAQALRMRLLAEPRPTNLIELASRYEKLFAEVDVAWEELKKGAGEKKIEALPDPTHEALRSFLYDPRGVLALPKSIEAEYPEGTIAELKQHRDNLQSLESALPRLPEAMAVSEGKPENLRVHLRGSHLTLGPETRRGFPRVLAGDESAPLGETQSGRLEFARWLTSPEHPLTSRVMANRLWLWHFGEGLVRSPDNFGRLGERPTHPALLDHLATQLVRGGWSLKAMHRAIMLSSTYQMSTRYDDEAAAADPENRLWWRMNRRRLEAEAIRDAILAVSGTIDFTMEGSLLPTPNRQYVTSTASVNPAIYDAPRRSIYLPVVRSALYEVFQAFDFADPSTLSGKRDTTTVAPQALFMINSKFVLEQTRTIASGLLANSGVDDAGRIRQLYEGGLSRLPTDRETARGLEFIERYSDAAAVRSTPADESRLRAWQALCRTVLSSNEFIYVE